MMMENLDLSTETTDRTENFSFKQYRDSIDPLSSQLAKEALRSSTIEQLLSQNDDLMARLKVSLRKLSTLEQELKVAREESYQIKQEQQSREDRILVLKEKDNYWKMRLESFEKQNFLLSEKLKAIKNAYEQSSKVNQRHQKYQLRIRQQVKPYIESLKKYSISLETQIDELKQKENQNLTELQELKIQILELSKNYQTQLEQNQQFYESSSKSFEENLERLQTENETLKTEQNEVHRKLEQYAFTLEKNSILENELIETKRILQQKEKHFENALLEKTDQLSKISGHSAQLEVQIEDRNQKILADYSRIQELERNQMELRHQMDSLRYMFNSKSNECDQLKESLQALERINIELSKKLSTSSS